MERRQTVASLLHSATRKESTSRELSTTTLDSQVNMQEISEAHNINPLTEEDADNINPLTEEDAA